MTLKDPDNPILIVGAGPSGLATAITLTDYLLSCKVIDKSWVRSETSKATGLHPQTINYLIRQGGRTALEQHAHRLEGNLVYADRQLVKRQEFVNGSDLLDGNVSVEQAVTEQILLDRLAEAGHRVARGVEFVGATNGENSMDVTLIKPQGADTRLVSTTTPLLIGADGVASRTRDAMQIEFVGQTFRRKSFALDCEILGNPYSHDYCHQFFGVSGTMTLVPMRGHGRFKLTGSVPDGMDILPEMDSSQITDLIARAAQQRAGIDIVPTGGAKPSVYWLRDSIAERYTAPRCALVGDAAHALPPFGGFGLNTAIGDGVALGKALANRPLDNALFSYEKKRRPYALLVQEHIAERRAELNYRQLKGIKQPIIQRELKPTL